MLSSMPWLQPLEYERAQSLIDLGGVINNNNNNSSNNMVGFVIVWARARLASPASGFVWARLGWFGFVWVSYGSFGLV